MDKKELIESLRNEYIQGLITEDYYKGKNWGINIALGLVNQLDEPDHVVCAENERTTQLVEVPQFIAETIEKYKENDNSLGELLSSVEHANIKYYHGMEKHRVNFNNFFEPVVDLCATIARAWLDGYTISPPKTLQVIVKSYDSTVYKTEIPEDEAMKLIEGWKEDE